MRGCFRLDDDSELPRTREKRWKHALPLASEVLAILLLLSIFLPGTTSVSGRRADGGDGGGNNDNSSMNSGNYNPVIFQPAHCPFKLGAGIVEGQQVNCGYVSVPENREVNDGKTVKLAVAIFKAPQYMNSIDPAPVLRLEGGPGEGSLASWAAAITARNYKSLVFNHDLVFFDQRGTGYSTPSLRCTELSPPIGNDLIIGGRLIAQNLLSPIEKLYQACYNRLNTAGIDLDGFNTLQNADDVADLIHALGYQKMTLYGVSYGTLLALTVMRLHPDVVRAAVLDSVAPPDAHATSIDSPANTQRIFNTLFQGCEQNAICNARYPDLQHVLYTLVDSLNASPVQVTATDLATQKQKSVTLNGTTLMSWIFQALYVTSMIPSLPRIIYALKEHDYQGAASLINFNNTSDTSFSDGMYYSTECSEEWPFVTQQDINNSIADIAPQIARYRSILLQEGFDICQFWKVKPVPAEQKQPVASALPTLVLAGEYDPITPPEYGQRVAKNLSQSYFFLFPGQGHGELYNSVCSDRIISAFEDSPNQRPDASCIAQMSEPAFQ